MAMMTSLMSHKTGGPESLTLEDHPLKEPGAGQIRIRTAAAGVNFPDTLIIRDLYQFKPPRPFAPGGEIAGYVDVVGEGVTDFKKGDRVLALTGHGGFSTHAIIPAQNAHHIPASMPFDRAAGFIMTYATSHYALTNRADIKAGETLFILGAAGGVGSAAIELAKAMNVKTIAGVSSEEKADFCKNLGADEMLIYPRGKMERDQQKTFSSELKTLAGPAGVNVVYDAVGGDYAEPAIRALAWEGRYLVVGFPAGIPKIPLNLTLLKSCQILGVFWGAFTMRDPAGHKQNMKELFQLYETGKIRPQITKTFPLKKAADALQMLDARTATGKLIINMDN